MLERHAKMIQLLLNKRNQYINADEIAMDLNISNRTVRNDIKFINSEILKALIISVKGRGYKLNFDEYDVMQIEGILSEYKNKESEILIKLAYQLLMYEQPITIEQLANTYHLTKAEINDFLSKISAWSLSFEVTIKVTKRKGITVSGSEMNIRNAILHLNQLSENIQNVDTLILNELPKAHINKMTKIIEETLKTYHIHTSRIRIKQLLIHLIIIFKRSHDEDGQSWVIDDTAYDIALQCVTQINQALGYHLTKETAKLLSFFISYYFNQYDLGLEKIFVKSYIERMIYQMEKIVGIAFSTDLLLQENLFEHFSRTYLRIAKDVYINNPLTDDIKKHYPFVFNALYETVTFLSKDSDIHLVEDEIAFLALHFQSSIDRNDKEIFNIVITCYYGVGISSLLEAKIANLDDRISIVVTLKFEQVEQYDFTNVDALVTTHAIETDQLPAHVTLIEVSPLFSEEDGKKILTSMHHKQNPLIQQDELANIQFDIVADRQESLNASFVFEQAQEIFDRDYSVMTDYIQSALERERFSSTYIGNAISIPHGDPEKVLKSHVIIFKNQQGFTWKQNKAKIIFFLAIAEHDISIMKKMIQRIANITETDVQSLLRYDDQQFKEHIMKFIKT
ncbi:BglG family transcription antiterminator [Staphylococcus caeli]|uniref:BglG family transcription antiterminator n=1 Tax=Staphylococcus caeli TaxID=2201815 RepID=UPI003F578B95